MSTTPLLQFASFSSAVEAPFWQNFSTRKIDLYKLDDAPLSIIGYYSTGHSISSNDPTEANIVMPTRLCLGPGAFETESTLRLPSFSFPSIGILKNTNTIEEFKSLDKTILFKETAEKIWLDIISGKAIENPWLLNRFLLVTFADLKKYKYHYWFAFPALMSDPPWLIADQGAGRIITEVWNNDQRESLFENYNKFRQKNQSFNSGFFLIREKKSENERQEIIIGSLGEWEAFFSGLDDEERIVGFADPSSLPTNPGWPLRNLLLLIQHKWHVRKIKVLCYREIPGKRDISESRFLIIELPSEAKITDEIPKAVGWEKNSQGKLGPRIADLAPLMNPEILADTSIDLNLKLMRWRIVPSLNLEKIKETKCLLLGAGTLGCYVGRILLGWGVRHITFVDNSRISFSNPVRQPLFFFEDCLDGGKPKAETAAINLKKIYPGVTTQGHDLTIPMPGHPIFSVEQVENEVYKLQSLIQSHDVIFLLTDSRESRWLPTLISASLDKLVINAALGFDSFVVMRHGIRGDNNTDLQSKDKEETLFTRLGCYFCNDIIGPGDTLKDRTLDQQCTVSRPGLASITAALAVELMVSVLTKGDGVDSASDEKPSENDSPLGVIPHQIRGFLSDFKILTLTGNHYTGCTACSDTILTQYQQHGWEFLLRALQSPKWIEELTGLTKLHNETEKLEDFATEWDED
ncbi:hypothetical protein G9A89_003227 [Geosiphon pyriformis]|nr:hypothetical protein G9A89_003227 [Geosiphon pyriformis]